jgi:hypothetical protein
LGAIAVAKRAGRTFIEREAKEISEWGGKERGARRKF